MILKTITKKNSNFFLLGIFHEKIDIECYLIQKDRYNDKIDILSNYDHRIALKIKKIYYELFKLNILDKFNDKSLRKYMSFLLSDYFFPDITEKDYKRISEQLFMMYKNDNCDENLLFYYFQIQNDILFKIFKKYKEKSDSDIEEFIRKFFKGDILNFFEKRILFVKSNSEKIKDFNRNDSWEST